MRKKTTDVLDAVADAAVESLKAEAAMGCVTPESIEDARAATKIPTPAEVVKTMIRRDVKAARAMLGEGAETPVLRLMVNVMKTRKQFDYLAGAIDARLKGRARRDKAVKALYGAVAGRGGAGRRA